MSDSDDSDSSDILNESFLKRFVGNNTEVLEQISKFKTLCQNAITKDEIFELVTLYTKILKTTFMIKIYYNKFIGWALPSKESIEVVVEAFHEHIKTYPEAKIIDFGAGSGIFAYLFEQLGIPKEKIVAVDLPNPTHSDKQQRNFYPIIRDEEYEVEVNDIMF
ncbi:MAG: hypothetical protein MUO21_10625, partial [Nitrososphaeraceae archaeon]|nr:hypothetical protein [Nitrososphaeraceae archaeon]